MKTTPSKTGPTLFRPTNDAQPVRVIKATQASKILGNLGHQHSSIQPTPEQHKKPEIRLVHTGTDYCDLEVICGCGESTQVRCWNTPATVSKAA